MMLWTDTIIECKTGVIMKILQGLVDGLVSISDSQSGFVQEQGTTDATFVVRQMKEKCLTVNKHIYMAFLALEKPS